MNNIEVILTPNKGHYGTCLKLKTAFFMME